MPDNMPDQIKTLRALASKATPGPYVACAWDPMERPHVTSGVPCGHACRNKYDLPQTGADAAYLAMLDPATVLKLLDCVEALKAINTLANERGEQPGFSLETQRIAQAALTALREGPDA